MQWLSDEQLLALIRSIHAEVKGSYGSPRMLEELKARGFPASKGRVRRLMQAHGIRARHKRRYKATTNSKHKLPVAENVLAREFTTESPDQVWTVDITYIPTGEGWLYLAVVMDLYSRMIVGWAMDERMTRELAMTALRMAKFRRKPAPGLLHHSDRGSQGGFNRSSQHLKLRRCCDGTKCKAGVSVDRASSDVLTGCAVA